MSEKTNNLSDGYSPYFCGDAIDQSWACFIAQYDDDAAAFDALYQMLDEKTPHCCHHCQSNNLEKLGEPRIFSCRDCHKQSWFTAGTFFHNMRKPKAWLGAIWLMERGFKFSAKRFAKLARVAYDTAWRILKKMEMVIEQHFSLESSLIPSLDFLESVCKRSIKTPANYHPICEQTMAEVKHPANQAIKPVEGLHADDFDSTINALSEDEHKVFDNLSDEPMSFDALCATDMSMSAVSSALAMLEVLRLVKPLPGEKYIRAPYVYSRSRTEQVKKLEEVEEADNADEASAVIVSEMTEFVKTFLHGISRKYLQLYLGKFWCIKSRLEWGKDKLFRACATSKQITYGDILSYVSPLNIMVPIADEPK